jgi:hypothetical protein
MRKASFRNSVYWLLLADILIRFWIARDPPPLFRNAGLLLHFLVGIRIGIVLLSRIRPANFVASAPLLLYGISLVFSTLAIDRFSLLLQLILTLLLVHTSIATNEAYDTATESNGDILSPSPSEPALPEESPGEAGETRPKKWRIVLGVLLVCATAALNLYLATFNTEGFNGMAVMFTHLFFYTPVLLALSLPLLVSSRRGLPPWNQWLFGLFFFLFILSWVILMARAYGVW